MPLFKTYTHADVCWGIWKVEEEEDELLSMLPSRNLYLAALQRFTSPHRRVEWLAVRVLLNTLLGEEKEILYHSSGRPYLSDASISISHTKGYVAVLLADVNRFVGIDIEQVGERVRRVAHKFVNDDEQIQPYEESDIWSLLLHWSAKESMFKCMDTSGVDFLEHLHILPFKPVPQGHFQAYETCTPENRRYTIYYLLHPQFVMTWIA
ncbi:MAG: 4'-phosphopantetheinyl transferase superfamily protein [Mediterranea massiliensis]|nr:4'-phosphopantetheinyl transferase superfamily protein [Mediterranea massiliensis]